MILPFQTHFKDGTPTDFVGKIWAGLLINDKLIKDVLGATEIADLAYTKNLIRHFDYLDDLKKFYIPKLHSMREDAKDRWKPGMKIHMVVFNRSKNQFQFAPVLECTAVQEIFMTNIHGFEISIDDQYQYWNEKEKLALNDGFASLEQMENYFFPQNCKHVEWSGKIIHWTDVMY